MTETTQQGGGGRSWEWTPPAFMNKLMTLALKTPLLHRAISSQILLLQWTGHKSGKSYQTPVGYVRDGDTLTILTKRFRRWWHNFEQPAPVQVRVAGQTYKARATALTDVDTIAPIIADVIHERPREAEIFDINMLDETTPDMASVREMAPKIVVIRVEI